jgi:hypothetical protein
MRKRLLSFTLILYILFMVIGALTHTGLEDPLKIIPTVSSIQTKLRWFSGIPMFTHPKMEIRQLKYCFAFVSHDEDSWKIQYKSPENECSYNDFLINYDLFHLTYGLYLYLGVTRYWINLAYGNNFFSKNSFYEEFYKNKDEYINHSEGKAQTKYIFHHQKYIDRYTAFGRTMCNKYKSKYFSIIVKLQHYLEKENIKQDSFHHFLEYDCINDRINPEHWKKLATPILENELWKK